MNANDRQRTKRWMFSAVAKGIAKTGDSSMSKGKMLYEVRKKFVKIFKLFVLVVFVIFV